MASKSRRVDLTSSEPLAFDAPPGRYLVACSPESLASALGVTAVSAPVDWNREFLIVAGRGECPTGGYRISIDRVTHPCPEELRVILSFTDPGPTDMVTMVVTHPRDAAAVRRRGLEYVTRVVFVDRGGRLLETVEVRK